MGGIESHCEQVFPRLKALARHYNITIIGRTPYIPGGAYKYQGVRVVPLPAIKNKYLEAISNTTLAVLYARFVLRAEILHIHGIGPALLGPLARMLGMKLVVTHHGRDFERQKWNTVGKAALRLGERCATAAAHHIIVVSKSVTEKLRRRNPHLRGRIHYIPNGATEFAEIEASQDEQSILAQFELEPQRYILSVGRLVPEKGFHDLITAFHGADPAHKLAIAGAADHEDDYSRSLLRHASERIRFCGFQPHDMLRVLYRNAALFVLPSSHEGLPIAALEAANLGIPVLLSDIRPNLDIELAPTNYFPVGDVDALKRKLLTSYETYRVDRAVIARRFNWGCVSEATRQVYAALAAA
ncbi:glycosyltransferase family 4 protein [Dongia deserti]|uniref:glycosyltransferase family 4 protein n=1 Tax=Dongia deserti TaxID=2268030 RepID=UPI002548A9BD|nr:glycosyltransferase family 4 protein [Dongia deserti]